MKKYLKPQCLSVYNVEYVHWREIFDKKRIDWLSSYLGKIVANYQGVIEYVNTTMKAIVLWQIKTGCIIFFLNNIFILI
jgi:hypothetical protein